MERRPERGPTAVVKNPPGTEVVGRLLNAVRLGDQREVANRYPDPRKMLQASPEDPGAT